MDVKIKALRTTDSTNGPSTSKFYALLPILMDVNIKVLRTIANTNGRQHQSDVDVRLHYQKCIEL